MLRARTRKTRTMANALDNVMCIRRRQPTRLEGFVDASFAVTLVVISIGRMQRSRCRRAIAALPSGQA